MKVSTTLTILGLTAALFGAAACKDRAEALQAVQAGLDLKLLPGVTEKERTGLAAVLADMVVAKIDGEVTPEFRAAFGGGDMPAVISYLNARLKYLMPIERYSKTPHPDLGAINPSVSVFLQALAKDRIEDGSAHVDFGDFRLTVRSPRVGLIALGPMFFVEGDRQDFVGVGYQPKVTWVSRSEFLVHEARHSDCAKLPTREQAVVAVKTEDRSAIPTCGYTHRICPELMPDLFNEGARDPHPYAGQEACDLVPWGAYAVGGTYLREIYRNCVSCSEQQRQEAFFSMVDSLIRLPSLDFAKGTPDMSSIE